MTDLKPKLSLKLRVLTALTMGMICGSTAHSIFNVTPEFSAAIGLIVALIILIVISW